MFKQYFLVKDTQKGTQNKDTHNKDTQHNGLICDNQPKWH
jgi:hypothetical protein